MKYKLKEALLFIQRYLVIHGDSPSLRELQRGLNYRSPRSAQLLVEELITEEYLKRNADGELCVVQFEEDPRSKALTVLIPLVGEVACGKPIFAEEDIIDHLPVSVKLVQPPYNYFFLRARGDSMDKKNIKDGDLLLVRKQSFAQSGDLVVALIDEGATVKEFTPTNEAIILRPHSTNPSHKPILLEEEFLIQGVVIKSFSNL